MSVASKKSKAATAVDIAPSAKAPSVAGTEAPPVAASAPASGGVGSFMSALSSGITPKAMLGGVIGAVATGAVAYAFYQAEQDSARAEAAHEARMAAYERGRAPSTREPAYAPAIKQRSLSAAPARTAYVHRNFSTTESIAPPPRQHRNFSVTESRVTPRPPPTKVPTQAPTAMKAIEARAFDNDSEIQTMMTKHTSRRPENDDDIQTVLSKHTSRHPDNVSEIQTVMSKNTSRRPDRYLLNAAESTPTARSKPPSAEAPLADRRPRAARLSMLSRTLLPPPPAVPPEAFPSARPLWLMSLLLEALNCILRVPRTLFRLRALCAVVARRDLLRVVVELMVALVLSRGEVRGVRSWTVRRIKCRR
jgi:hypothetical protein